MKKSFAVQAADQNMEHMVEALEQFINRNGSRNAKFECAADGSIRPLNPGAELLMAVMQNGVSDKAREWAVDCVKRNGAKALRIVSKNLDLQLDGRRRRGQASQINLRSL